MFEDRSEQLKRELAHLLEQYAHVHNNQDMAHEEHQPTLHQHGKDIASISRELLSHEPDNTFAKTIFSWFALALNGLFFGHPEIDHSEHVPRIPEHIGDDEDLSHLLDEIEYYCNGHNTGDGAEHHSSHHTGEDEYGAYDDQNRYNDYHGDEHQYGHGDGGQHYGDDYGDQGHYSGHGHGGW